MWFWMILAFIAGVLTEKAVGIIRLKTAQKNLMMIRDEIGGEEIDLSDFRKFVDELYEALSEIEDEMEDNIDD